MNLASFVSRSLNGTYLRIIHVYVILRVDLNAQTFILISISIFATYARTKKKCNDT